MPSGFEPLKAFVDFRLSLVSSVNGARSVKEAGLVLYLTPFPIWVKISNHIRIMNWRTRNTMRALSFRHQISHETSKLGSHPMRLQSNACYSPEISSHRDKIGQKAPYHPHDNLTSHTPHPSLSSMTVLILRPSLLLILHAPLQTTTMIPFVLCLLSRLLRPTFHFHLLASSNHPSRNHPSLHLT